MGSTHLSLHYHIVFATKRREMLIAEEWRSRLHEYLGGTLRGLDTHPAGIGGTSDHVHLLMSLKATHRLSDVVRELKKSSSSWIHETLGIKQFAWQDGYAAFTVSASGLESVRRYIANQEQHHRTKTFKEELVGFLEKSGVNYKAEYL